MASKKRHRSDNALASATANLVCVPLLPRLEELVAHAAREHSCWSRLLDEVVRAAALTDAELHAEGRREALRQYGAIGGVEHFWPDPPSVTVLVDQSVRTTSEAAFFAELEAFCAGAAAADVPRCRGE